MTEPIQVTLRRYEATNDPKRIAVGDVICCSSFDSGFQRKENAYVFVGWRSQAHLDALVCSQSGSSRFDSSRAVAPFLVTQIWLETNHGPDDVFPEDEWRMSRVVKAIRLEADFMFMEQSEEIRFSLNEPMSLAEPDEETIQILGYAELPIVWRKSAR